MTTPLRGVKRDTNQATNFSRPEVQKKSGNILDARKLIEEALNLGLICSVLRAKKGPGLKNKILKAARNADIVTLDWEIENDGGKLATDITIGIVKSDIRQNGRVRLIAIYTSTRNRTKIVGDIKKKLNSDCRGTYKLENDSILSDEDSGFGGLRIICLYKTTGIRKITPAQKSHEVKEKDLPERLLLEFSKLSEGLLGNVAMATIASIRDVTHHVLKTFDGKMDGPYFQHRVMIPEAHEAEDYAIDLVLSEIKKSVIRKNIKPLIDVGAVERSISHKILGSQKTLTYRDKKKRDKELIFTPEQVQGLIGLGMSKFIEKKCNSNIPNFNKEINNRVAKGIITLFEADLKSADYQLLKFASLSQLGHRPNGHSVLLNDVAANLTTGSIILTPDKKTFLICLQATCDTVRRPQLAPFIFAKLKSVDYPDRKPVFVVPAVERDGFDILEVDENAYTNLDSINFVTDSDLEVVPAVKSRGRRGFYFVCADGKYYRWLGNAKARRSLRAIQSIAQDMGRIGFDEFEPFRV